MFPLCLSIIYKFILCIVNNAANNGVHAYQRRSEKANLLIRLSDPAKASYAHKTIVCLSTRDCTFMVKQQCGECRMFIFI